MHPARTRTRRAAGDDRPRPGDGDVSRPSSRGPATLLGGAAALWLLAFFLRATSSGSGSTISSRAFADLIGAGTLTGSAPRWFGAVLYLVPVAAAIVLMTLASDHPTAVGVRVAAAAVATVAATAFFLVVADWRPARLGPGAWTALAGGGLAVAGTIATLRRTEEQA